MENLHETKFPVICDKRDGINEIHNTLIEYGFIGAADDTAEINRMIDVFQINLEKKIEKLKDVWKAVELCKKGQVDIFHVKQAVNKYHNE